MIKILSVFLEVQKCFEISTRTQPAPALRGLIGSKSRMF